MKKQLFFVFVTFACIVAVAAVGQKSPASSFDYSQRWKEIDSLANEKQLIESALKEVDGIASKAKAEKNTVQQMKAAVYKMRLILQKDPDKAPQLIADFESVCTNFSNQADKALACSMTAELYLSYYNSKKWMVDERTEVAGDRPEDINEWTRGMFIGKISNLLDMSLQMQSFLQQPLSGKYEPLLNKGDDSEQLEPTLFDFLCHRKIQLLSSLLDTDIKIPDNAFLPVDQFAKQQDDTLLTDKLLSSVLDSYKALLIFHLNDLSATSLINDEISRLNFLNKIDYKPETYIENLNFLADKYKNQSSVVEVWNAQAEYYLSLTDSVEARKKAFEICESGIKAFPEYKRIGLLKNMVDQITAKSLVVNHSATAHSKSEIKLNIQSTNLSNLKINIYRVNASSIEYYKYRLDYRNKNTGYPDRTLQASYMMRIPVNSDFRMIDTSFVLQSGSYGVYEVSVSDPACKMQTSESNFVVTDFAYITRGNQSLVQNVYVLDSKSGLPQKNVEVNAAKQTWNGAGYDLISGEWHSSDKNGFLLLPYSQNYGNYLLCIRKGEDQYFCKNIQPYFFENNPSVSASAIEVTLFTDRAVYRPGQVIHFKGIAYYSDSQRNEVVFPKQINVDMYDANNKKVNTIALKTNQFGSFSGEFILPDKGLNGNYTLKTAYGQKDFYVEEYKRPTFEVLLEKPEKDIRFGEQVALSGEVKAYAGYPMAGVKVNYRITRMPHRYCWWMGESEKEIETGTTISDKDGRFKLAFVPRKGTQLTDKWKGIYFTYMVSVDVTDNKGETEQCTQTVSVGDKSLFILPTIPDKIEKSAETVFNISVETLNGKRFSTDVRYEIYQLQQPSDYIENRKDENQLKNKKKVIDGCYNTADSYLKLNTDSWSSGCYRLVLTVKDTWGNEVKTENVFVLYSAKDMRPVVKSYVWQENRKTECLVGENAVIRFGTSTTHTKVLYEIMQNASVLESKWIDFNDQIKDFKIPFMDAYGSGVNVVFTFMKDGKFFQQIVQITRKVNPKKLTPLWSVFRDKLQPGENSEWTVTIPELKNTKKTAEVLVDMYDASLDAIRPHDWSFQPQYRENVSYSPVWLPNDVGVNVGNSYDRSDKMIVPDWTLNSINWFGLGLMNQYDRLYRVESDQMYGIVENIKPNYLVLGYSVMKTQSPKNADKVITSDVNDQKLNVRTNFSETAFFYPHLQTDSVGNAKFSFTVPESLTRWNIKMLAHTPDLYVGQFDTTAITQKKLMVQMNVPRFVRKSDKLTLVANVINLTDSQQTVNVRFQLLNSFTNQPLKLKDKELKTIVLRANESKSVQWELTEFSPFELVVCKVVAQSEDFSDGEQQYLPILPDKLLITETLPLFIRNNQPRVFRFDNLINKFSSVESENMTVEFASHPVWYAVQALSSVSTPNADNTFDLFSAVYANTLAEFIVSSNPKIRKIFDQWRTSKDSKDAFLSNLDKNSELKNMLREETPWLATSGNESEQKRRIALLFDLNDQKDKIQQYWDKLFSLQTPDGGFSWYKEMPENRYITQFLLLNYARLQSLTGRTIYDERTQTMVSNALNYLDREILKDYTELKIHNKNYLRDKCIDATQLLYLRLRCEYPEIQMSESTIEAVKYYTSQAEKYWTTFSLYEKAMAILVALRDKKTSIAQNILKSIKEYAIKTDEMGMYWSKNTSGYYWSERPITVQVALLEAFNEMKQDDPDIDEMKIWLLRQKQTERWDSPVTTVEAIYTLLFRGSNWLDTDDAVRIVVGDKEILPSLPESGTGYVKQTIPAKDISPLSGTIKISPDASRGNSEIGWGAVYWQYYQDQSKVANSSSGLKVTKKLFKKSGNLLVPVEQVSLVKGDKIVTRFVVSTDRDMEFVALKDCRAACLEPVDQRSGCEWKEGICYYRTIKDASTQFYFDYLPKGTYVFDDEQWVNNSGIYTNGVASIQCLYAPEFVSYAGGSKLEIK